MRTELDSITYLIKVFDILIAKVGELEATLQRMDELYDATVEELNYFKAVMSPDSTQLFEKE